MTKIRKYLLLAVCLCLLAVGCGSNEDTDYNGYTAEQLSANNISFFDQLMGMSDVDLAMYETYQDQMDPTAVKAVLSWTEIKDELGDFEGYGDASVTEANGTTTVDQTASFENRDVKITFVYDKDMNVTDVNVDKVYTLGETMSNAAMNTLMGMGTVFVMLIIISLLISCFKFINKAQAKAEGKKAAAAPKVAPAPASVPAAQAAPAAAAPADDGLELVAVISAAVAASSGAPADGFVVRSIKRR